MTSYQKISFIALMLFMMATTSFSAPNQVYLHLHSGEKKMDRNGYDLDKLLYKSATIDYQPTPWPFTLRLSYLVTLKEATIANQQHGLYTSEIRVGAIKLLHRKKPGAPHQNRQKLTPYFGGGLTKIDYEAYKERPPIRFESNNSGTGLWLTAGLIYHIIPFFHLGLEANVSKVSVSYFDQRRNIGGTYWGIFSGIHF